MGACGILPGFLATTGDSLDPDVCAATSAETTMCGPVALAHWGLASITSDVETFVLSGITRTERGEVSPGAIAAAMRENPRELAQLLPPFAAVRGDDRGVSMVADSMGFRQLYHSASDSPVKRLLATSAILAGWQAAAQLDQSSVAVQSLLGWQLGQGTLFRGIQKLAPGAVARLDANGVDVRDAESMPQAALSLDEAVRAAAGLLRVSLAALLDEYPDAVLQLTGGQDSRILLSAIPVARRRGVRAMTLRVPGGGDVAVATELAARYGLRHEVRDLSGLDSLDPADAWGMTRAAAFRLDGMSDPIALAALTVAERSFEQGVRISGLGGEIARGFYYVGRVRDRPVTRAAAEQLAKWRMFVNEAVEPSMLRLDFAEWARETANSAVYTALADSGNEWFRATDELYLRHRMQRWAGVTDTAVAYQRKVINPMLDPQFLSIASRLTPYDKANSRFLARLQMELDPDLGRIPLEGRPAPIVYAYPNLWRTATLAASTGRRLAKKAIQRISRGSRPPAGGTVMAAKVVAHWRQEPSILSGAPLRDFVGAQWLDQLMDGRIQPRPSSVALIANLVAATTRAP